MAPRARAPRRSILRLTHHDAHACVSAEFKTMKSDLDVEVKVEDGSGAKSAASRVAPNRARRGAARSPRRRPCFCKRRVSA